MTLEEARSKLTAREFEFLQAMLAKDDLKLRAFGDDAVYLAKSVEYKILEAGGIDAEEQQVKVAGTQLKLFETPEEKDPEKPDPEDQELLDSLDQATKKHFNERGSEDRQLTIPPVVTDRPLATGPDLDGLERSSTDATAPAGRPRDVLDEAAAGHAPFRKGDVIRGDRVMYIGAIHRVLGVDRTTEPHTIKLSVFGKEMHVSRERVAKVAPMGYDRRWAKRRAAARRTQQTYPSRFDNEAQAGDGYDPQDHSS